MYHRYFAHRAFKMNRGARFVWTLIGTAAMQKGPIWWAGHHVTHHKFADRDGDPHSPMISGFYYAHVGWFLHDTKYDQLDASNPVVRDFGEVSRRSRGWRSTTSSRRRCWRSRCMRMAAGRGSSTASACRR